MICIGNHVSVSKGYEAMGKMESALGGTTFAFFTRNPRGGNGKIPDPEDVARLVKLLEQENYGKLVAHAPYTMNLCSDRPEVRTFARTVFEEDLHKMEGLSGQLFNFHPGSHVGQGTEIAITQIAEVLNQCIRPEQTTTVLLETMAGKGTEVGRRFEELREIMDRVEPEKRERIGICMDTCHVWDGGYDIVHHLDEVLQEFDERIGLVHLKALHLNDSMNSCGAHKDRHQKLGLGEIGQEALRRVVQHPVLQNKPFILETPNDDEGYRREIALVKSWIQ